MAFAHFLAMTSAEFNRASSLPRPMAWMACHFSPYATGLSNLPERLPEGSLLILNDRTPMHGHDPLRILAQLEDTIQRFRCFGLLLDLQRPGVTEAKELADVLFHGLACPVCVTPEYAPEGCPVFLPPIPVTEVPETYLRPWYGRDIWLESALNSGEILLTERGSAFSDTHISADMPFFSETLFCHYRIETEPTAVRFSLSRTPGDLKSLLNSVQALGVTAAVGLYQELGER